MTTDLFSRMGPLNAPQGFPDLLDALDETLQSSLSPGGPANTDAQYAVLRGAAWNPWLDPIDGLTTPQASQLITGGKIDEDGGGGVGYAWSYFANWVNPGTKPTTGLATRGRGNVVYPLSTSGRGYGATPQVHAGEATFGAFPSVMAGRATLNSNTIQPPSGQSTMAPATAFEGSRYDAGMVAVVSGGGASVPAGTTIVSVTDRPGFPTAVQLSNPVTGIVGTQPVTLTAYPVTPETIGWLLTGNGWDGVGGGNPVGIGVQLQAYDPQSAVLRGINMGASSLRAADGVGWRLSLTTGLRIFSAESTSFQDGFVFTNSAFSGSIFLFGAGATAQYAIEASPSFAPSGAFAYLPGQTIDSDGTTGLKILSVSTRKLGFFGRTPQVRPSVNGAASNAAASPPTKTEFDALVALVNSIRAAGLNAGTGLGFWA